MDKHALTIAAFTLLLFPVGCERSNESTGDGMAQSRFWQPLHISGREVVCYSTIRELTEASASVVVGKMRNYRLSRVIQGDVEEDTVAYAGADIEVVDEIKTTGESKSLLVEFLVPTATAAAAREVIEQQARNLPSDDILLFLHAKRGTDEAGLFRPVCSNGVWAMKDGVVELPLADEDIPDAFVEIRDGGGVKSIEEVATIARRHVAD